ncbi:MAG: aminotransferase class V-fold PLP-dependent enzyme, partial [Myxococcota bacterium]
MTTDTLYFDANADSVPNERALAAYLAEARRRPGPEEAASRARVFLDRVRTGLGASSGVVIPTRGGTRADAWALRYLVSRVEGPVHVVTTTIEHAAIADTASLLEAEGACSVTRVAVGRHGRVDPDDIRRAMRAETQVVSVIAASNETGVLQPIREIAEVAQAAGAQMHTDAVQCIGRCHLDVDAWGVDFASFSAHKFGGLTGLGLVWARDPDVRASDPIVSTADYDLPGLAAVVAALESATNSNLMPLRKHLEEALARIEGAEIVGKESPRLSNTTLVRFAGCEGDGLMMALDIEGVAVSTGSACASGSIDPSPILLGMGLTREEASETIRLS